MSNSHAWRLGLPIILWIALVPPPALAQQSTLPYEALRDWQFHNNDGWRQLEKGNYQRAEERFNLAIKELKPHEDKCRRLMARSYCDLARVLYHEGRFAEAEPLAKWALSVREADSKAKPDAVFQSLYVLGMIHKGEKHHAEAEIYLKRALDVQEKNLQPGHAGTTVTLSQLASVYTEQGRYVDAVAAYKRVLATQERVRPDENLELADTAERLADVLTKLDRLDEAEKWKARALKIRDTVATKAARSQLDAKAKLFKSFE